MTYPPTQYPKTPYCLQTAELSEDGRYRFELVRQWEPSRNYIAWVMLNPSTADATKDDATIRRCRGFATAWGYGGIKIYNLFALRATDPSALHRATDPVGLLNDGWLFGIEPLIIIAAWGSHGKEFPDRVEHVATILRHLQTEKGKIISVLGWTEFNQPKHPLRLSSQTPLEDWTIGSELLPQPKKARRS